MAEELISRLKNSLIECNKHILKIAYDVNKMRNFMPLTVEKYNNLTDSETTLIDSYILRFTKLQDKMGKLFKQILEENNIDTEAMSFINVLNYMEKYNILDNTDEWNEVRKIRNYFTHEYPDDDKENIEQLNESFLMSKNIFIIYFKTNNYVLENILKAYNADITGLSIKQNGIDKFFL
ncbi:MAG: hypothetical protein ACYCT7_03980 [bacterium]